MYNVSPSKTRKKLCWINVSTYMYISIDASKCPRFRLKFTVTVFPENSNGSLLNQNTFCCWSLDSGHGLPTTNTVS